MKRLNNMKFFCVFLLFIGIVLSTLVYAANKDTASVTMSVPSICKLGISNSDQSIDLLQDASGEAGYEAGYVDGQVNKPSLIIDSNTNWKLTVSVSVDWSMIGSYKKNTSDIALKVTSNSGHQTGFTGFTPLSLTEQEIARHTAGVGDEIYNCNYRIMLDWGKDIPGTYVIVLGYTLTTQ